MTTKPKPPGDGDVHPQVLEEPGTGREAKEDAGEMETRAIWMRGLWMVVFALLFEVGKSLLVIGALVQFFWLLFAREKNRPLADFGTELADWLSRVALFQSGARDDKPFPFARWGRES